MELYDIWKQLDLSWQELEHEPVFTIEQAQAISDQLPGIGVKNLLLTDRKHTHYFLVLLHEDKRADVKSISQQTGVRHLTFGSAEELQQLLADMDTDRVYQLSEALAIANIDYDENIHNAHADAYNTALLFKKLQS